MPYLTLDTICAEMGRRWRLHRSEHPADPVDSYSEADHATCRAITEAIVPHDHATLLVLAADPRVWGQELEGTPRDLTAMSAVRQALVELAYAACNAIDEPGDAVPLEPAPTLNEVLALAEAEWRAFRLEQPYLTGAEQSELGAALMEAYEAAFAAGMQRSYRPIPQDKAALLALAADERVFAIDFGYSSDTIEAAIRANVGALIDEHCNAIDHARQPQAVVS